MRKRRIRRFRRRMWGLVHDESCWCGCVGVRGVWWCTDSCFCPSFLLWFCLFSFCECIVFGRVPCPRTWQDMQLSGNRRNALSGAEDEDGWGWHADTLLFLVFLNLILLIRLPRKQTPWPLSYELQQTEMVGSWNVDYVCNVLCHFGRSLNI
jgi:hypothetical protein